MFDPFAKRIAGHIAGFQLVAGEYEPIGRPPDKEAYPSDVLGLELRAKGTICASTTPWPARIC